MFETSYCGFSAYDDSISFFIERQQHKCARQYAGCSVVLLPDRYAFDHKDGARENGSLENAQALCLNCHGVKTAIERRCEQQQK
jgi:5-methylcytosine-specific restriction endonuclease McrA